MTQLCLTTYYFPSNKLRSLHSPDLLQINIVNFEHGSSTFLRNIGKFIPADKETYTRRHQSSDYFKVLELIPKKELPQTLVICVYVFVSA
jgi:hypothetical protein